MSTKHTPGPWQYARMILPPKAKDRRCGFVVNGPDRDPVTTPVEDLLPVRVCDIRVPVGVTGFTEGDANARLIAAAPELLGMLTEICAHVIGNSRGSFEIAPDYIRQARAAIAKGEASP